MCACGLVQVREALVFSAMLRLPGAMSSRAKHARALAVAGLLNLGKSLDNVVGSSLIKGISGKPTAQRHQADGAASPACQGGPLLSALRRVGAVARRRLYATQLPLWLGGAPQAWLWGAPVVRSGHACMRGHNLSGAGLIAWCCITPHPHLPCAWPGLALQVARSGAWRWAWR